MDISVLRNYPIEELLPLVIDALRRWDSWDAVEENIEYIDRVGSSHLGTFFYPDATRSVAIAIQQYAAGYSVNDGMSICKVNGQTITDMADVRIVSPNSVVRIMQNNSALCVSAYSETSEDVPSNAPVCCFVADTVSQETGTTGVSVIGCISADENVYTLYSASSPDGISKAYPIQVNAPYTVLLPLVGVSEGVASGIYYPLMVEGGRKDIHRLTINSKTFYRCGRIAMIDYFVG